VSGQTASPGYNETAPRREGAIPHAGLASIKIMVFLIAFFSFGNFNPALVGAPDALAEMAQKLAVLGLWGLLIGTTFLPNVQQRPPITSGLLLPVVFLSWVVLSILWSNQPGSSVEKLAILVLTAFGTWRLTSALRAEEFFRILSYSLTALVLLSLILVMLVPSIGVLRTWQHAGQWSGIFVSKQTLGTVSALLVFLSMLRLLYRFSTLSLAGFAVALACVIGSGSRGGAVLAAAAVVCILVARRSPWLAAVMSALPIALLALACAAITFLVSSDLPYFPLGDQKVNLTERTLIWSFALQSWTERPLLGFGTNGFWTDAVFYDLFERKYGWVLDNYHSGYVSITIEYGLFGMVIFAAYVARLCWMMSRRIRASRGAPPQERFAVEAIFGFLVLCFTINLTETFFLRSTDFFQITLTYVSINLFAGAAAPAEVPLNPMSRESQMRPAWPRPVG
jgi:O-antigen ligase